MVSHVLRRSGVFAFWRASAFVGKPVRDCSHRITLSDGIEEKKLNIFSTNHIQSHGDGVRRSIVMIMITTIRAMPIYAIAGPGLPDDER